MVNYRAALIAALIHISIHAGPATAVLQAVEHTIPNKEASDQLEIGSLKLFFDDIPSVQAMPQRGGRSSRQTFFFPGVTKGRILKDMESFLFNKKNDKYHVEIASVTAPTVGTQVTFRLEDPAIRITPSSFDTIEGRKGIIFRLFNNDLINRIYRSEKTILHTAAISG